MFADMFVGGIPLEMPMSNFDSKDFWAWHGKKMCRPWSQLAGNMPGRLALIRGNESHIGDYNLIFFVFFVV